MSPLQLVLVYVLTPLLLLGVVGGAAWWTGGRRAQPSFPVLRRSPVPVPVAPPRDEDTQVSGDAVDDESGHTPPA